VPEGQVQIRRALLDDLDDLRGLWTEFRLPAHELEKRFTEFQLVTDPSGWLVGAVGLRTAGTQGQVHSEALRRPDLHAELRPLLWERLHQLALSRGVFRLWTREAHPFWRERGFEDPGGDERKLLPPAFGAGDHWLTLKLRDDPLALLNVEQQLELHAAGQRAEAERMMRRGRMLKLVGTALAAVIFILSGALLLAYLRRVRRR
jgi:N-acetylglutamate synthase-like GNAT family acetyltransferase